MKQKNYVTSEEIWNNERRNMEFERSYSTYSDDFYERRMKVPTVKKFEEACDSSGNSLGVYLGKISVEVHHSGAGSTISKDESDVLEDLVNGTLFENGDLRLVLSKVDQQSNEMWLSISHEYMVFGVKRS